MIGFEVQPKTLKKYRVWQMIGFEVQPKTIKKYSVVDDRV